MKTSPCPPPWRSGEVRQRPPRAAMGCSAAGPARAAGAGTGPVMGRRGADTAHRGADTGHRGADDSPTPAGRTTQRRPDLRFALRTDDRLTVNRNGPDRVCAGQGPFGLVVAGRGFELLWLSRRILQCATHEPVTTGNALQARDADTNTAHCLPNRSVLTVDRSHPLRSVRLLALVLQLATLGLEPNDELYVSLRASPVQSFPVAACRRGHPHQPSTTDVRSYGLCRVRNRCHGRPVWQGDLRGLVGVVVRAVDIHSTSSKSTLHNQESTHITARNEPT